MSIELSLGVKSDPITYRYTFDWLFDLMRNNHVENMQLGSFFELYQIDDSFFVELRKKAESRGIQITSCFTAHRELGGFMTNDPRFAAVTRRNYERLIEVAALLGSDYCGSNAGAVPRDKPETKRRGVEIFLQNMKELMTFALEQGLQGLTIEPMSCEAEPPSSSSEIVSMMTALGEYHKTNSRTVPVYLCGDISHGLADDQHRVVEDNKSLFLTGIPWMAEFHFKNTDSVYGSTFGFDSEERRRGIIDLKEVVRMVYENAHRWPVSSVVGYLELPGPKLGRDYSDHHLGLMLESSISAIQDAMRNVAVSNP
ncbi:MAG: TIM barrel protein [Spirochaetaceae bacterium]